MQISKIFYYIGLIVFICCSGCYSFTGGSIPSHLKTLKIMPILDESNSGNPENKVNLEALLLSNFRRDNSFELTETTGDARLNVTIVSVQETTQTINVGELETERKLTINCNVEYYDEVNKKQIWKKTFSNYSLFPINNSFIARNEAANDILTRTAEDILLAVVSGW